MAQKLCSGVLVSRRAADDVTAENLTGSGLEILRLFSVDIDLDAEQVTASLYGLVVETAIHRDGFGCTLLHGASAEKLRAQTAGLLRKQPPLDSDAEWPAGSKVSDFALASGVDEQAMRATIDEMFSEPDSSRLRRTWALVVVHKARIVAERYAPGFHKDMPLIGWSLSKTATNALVGMRVMDGVLSLEDEALVSQWRDKEDPRRSITLEELMRMTSGLEFDQRQDAPWMLFVEPDDAHFAASKPLAYSPGSHWSYSSGNTNIIAAILRETFADEREYLRFPQERLFRPLGMRTASPHQTMRAHLLVLHSCMPRHATGRGLLCYTCKTGYGKVSVSFRKAGWRTLSGLQRNLPTSNTERNCGSSCPNGWVLMGHLCHETHISCLAVMPITCLDSMGRW